MPHDVAPGEVPDESLCLAAALEAKAQRLDAIAGATERNIEDRRGEILSLDPQIQAAFVAEAEGDVIKARQQAAKMRRQAVDLVTFHGTAAGAQWRADMLAEASRMTEIDGRRAEDLQRRAYDHPGVTGLKVHRCINDGIELAWRGRMGLLDPVDYEVVTSWRDVFDGDQLQADLMAAKGWQVPIHDAIERIERDLAALGHRRNQSITSHNASRAALDLVGQWNSVVIAALHYARERIRIERRHRNARPERMPGLRQDLVTAIRAVDQAAPLPPADDVDQAAGVNLQQAVERAAQRRKQAIPAQGAFCF